MSVGSDCCGSSPGSWGEGVAAVDGGVLLPLRPRRTRLEVFLLRLEEVI